MSFGDVGVVLLTNNYELMRLWSTAWLDNSLFQVCCLGGLYGCVLLQVLIFPVMALLIPDVPSSQTTHAALCICLLRHLTDLFDLNWANVRRT